MRHCYFCDTPNALAYWCKITKYSSLLHHVWIKCLHTHAHMHAHTELNRKKKEYNRANSLDRSWCGQYYLSTCGSAALFPPDIGGGLIAAAGSTAAAAIWPSSPRVLTWPADQCGGRDCILQLTGCGEAAAHATWIHAYHCLGHITYHLSWTLLKEKNKPGFNTSEFFLFIYYTFMIPSWEIF